MKRPASLFHSATLRLAGWYTLILLFLSLLFSIVLYQISSHEIQRGFGPPRPGVLSEFIDDPTNSESYFEWRKERIQESQNRLFWQLCIFNLVVILGGAACSYVLARVTLRPVEDAYESQSRFSSDAAHELRTPLTVMQSEIEVGLRNPKATKASHAKLLSSNLDEIAHMRTLTDRLLMLANHQDMPLQSTSLEEVAIDAVGRIIPLAQAKRISIDNTVGAVHVTGNHDSLVDALVILIDNAIKYSPADTVVTLGAQSKGRHTELRVADSGPGIADDDLPHVFDRFYRADSSRSSQNVAGHGLGLSIAKQIVTAHHGRITAAKNPGSGLTFTITLPTG